MRDQHTSTRRTVCKTIASLSIGATALSAGVGASDRSTSVSRDDSPTAAELPAHVHYRFDVYQGVVDRIVDGRHVVILLEEDGEVIDQLVEPREDLPQVEETDRLVVVLDDGDLQFVVPVEPDRDDTR